jgi:ketosteroid isomerase-like protein
MPEFQKTIIGKNNVQVYFKAFLERFDVYEFGREEKEILDLGSVITELGMFRMKIRSKSTGRNHEVTGKYIDIWEKSGDGELALITEAWNYNHQLEIEDQFRFDGIPQVDVALQAHLPINNNISFELAGLNRLMESVVSQHDAKIWSQFYAEDGMFLYSRNRIYEGKEALNKFLDAHAKGLPVFEKLDIRNDCIDDLGSYVIEYASHVANWRNGEHSGVNTGKDLRIWRREKDCSLKIFRHIGMYD